jgi:hypothetical protein
MLLRRLRMYFWCWAELILGHGFGGCMTETQKQKNRREAPNVADIVDKFEAAFGRVKVTAAEDFVTGKKFGVFPEEKEHE